MCRWSGCIFQLCQYPQGRVEETQKNQFLVEYLFGEILSKNKRVESYFAIFYSEYFSTIFEKTVCPKHEISEKTSYLLSSSCYDLNWKSSDKAIQIKPKKLYGFEILGSGTEFRFLRILGLKGHLTAIGHHWMTQTFQNFALLRPDAWNVWKSRKNQGKKPKLRFSVK